jgi:hypothetical protein
MQCILLKVGKSWRNMSPSPIFSRLHGVIAQNTELFISLKQFVWKNFILYSMIIMRLPRNQEATQMESLTLFPPYCLTDPDCYRIDKPIALQITNKLIHISAGAICLSILQAVWTSVRQLDERSIRLFNLSCYSISRMYIHLFVEIMRYSFLHYDPI